MFPIFLSMASLAENVKDAHYTSLVYNTGINIPTVPLHTSRAHGHGVCRDTLGTNTLFYVVD